MPVAKGPRKGRRPSDPLIDDRVRKAEKAESLIKGRPNRQRCESLFAALSSPPATEPAAKPAIDAYTLLKSWRRARMNGDRANATALLAELQRLAERPRRKEGEHDDTDE